MSDADTMKKTGKHDWSRFDALTDEEVHAAALADPDAQPLTEERLARMKRVPRARTLRRALGLTQEELRLAITFRSARCAIGSRGARSPTSPRAPISTSSHTTRTACAALWKPARSLRRGNPLRRVSIVLPRGGVPRNGMDVTDNLKRNAVGLND
jgi:putative transcriptional regulator